MFFAYNNGISSTAYSVRVETNDDGRLVIKGMHNVENYLAAFLATKDDVSIENMKKVAETFSGVEHRCELVRELNGVKY